MRFRYCDFFLFRVNHKNSSRNLLHIFNPAKILLKFLQFALHQDDFFLRILFGSSVFKHFFQFLQAGYASLDSTEVGKHAAEPTFIYIKHIATLGFFSDRILSLFLCSDKQDRCSCCCHFTDKSISFFYFFHCLLQVNDINTITFGEDVPCHLRIPATGLMPEMNACFKQLFHGYN